jgi:hypothetical protein
MSIQIDMTRPLRRPNELLQLVQAIAAALPQDEAHWVEWKSTLPLNAVDGWFTISKQILGFANRHPDRAARFVGGNGYVIIGAEPGNVVGIQPVDGAQLDSWLETYIGADGPVWSLNYIELQGKAVLVIIVEAPTWGQPVYPLRRTYQPQGKTKGGADDGTVFVRREASTERANSAEIDMLTSRATRGSLQAPLALSLGWVYTPTALISLEFSADAVRRWIDTRRDALYESLHEGIAKKRADARIRKYTGIAIPQTYNPLMAPDERTAKQYESQVDSYLAQCEEALPHEAQRVIVERGLNKVSLKIENPSDRTVPDVQLVLHVPGEILAFEEDEWGSDTPMPSPPKPFGAPRPLMQQHFAYGSSSSVIPRGLHGSGLRIENGGSATLTFSAGDIRPRSSVKLESFHLITTVPGPGTVTATWRATSTGIEGVQDGHFDVEISDRSISIADLIPAPDDAE